jgi:hypothetical protein
MTTESHRTFSSLQVFFSFSFSDCSSFFSDSSVLMRARKVLTSSSLREPSAAGAARLAGTGNLEAVGLARAVEVRSIAE